MEEIIRWIRPIISGIVGVFFVWLMVAMTKEKSERVGNVRLLTYGKGFKIFSALLIPFSGFVVYAVSKSYKGQEVPAFLAATGFVLVAIYLAYQAFLVRFGYDEKFIYYKSPLAGNKKVSWEKLVDVGYSSLLQSNYIIVDGIGKIWCSNMLNGYEELGEFLEKKVQELYQEES